MILLVEPEHHSTLEGLLGAAGAMFTGGVGFRYIRIAIQTMPSPEGKSVWYGWAYRFFQQAFDNGHLLPEKGAGEGKGGDPPHGGQ